MASIFKLHASCRLLTVDDIDEIMLIEKQCYPFPWSKEVMLDCLRGDFIAIAATNNKQIVGYVVLSHGAQESHVLNLCVLESFRKKKLAQRLLQQAFKVAQIYAVQDVYLEVRFSNKAAIALYYKLGFNEIGLRVGYYPSDKGREDAIVMAKSILSI